MITKQRIIKLHNEIELQSSMSKPHPFVSEIIVNIDLFLKKFENSNPDETEIKQLAIGMGRLISDDFNFAESKVGNLVLDFINETL